MIHRKALGMQCMSKLINNLQHKDKILQIQQFQSSYNDNEGSVYSCKGKVKHYT